MDSGAQQSLNRFDYLLNHIDLEAYGRAMEQMDPDALGDLMDMPAAAALAMLDDVAGGEWDDASDMQEIQLTHELETILIHESTAPSCSLGATLGREDEMRVATRMGLTIERLQSLMAKLL